MGRVKKMLGDSLLGIVIAMWIVFTKYISLKFDLYLFKPICILI